MADIELDVINTFTALIRINRRVSSNETAIFFTITFIDAVS